MLSSVQSLGEGNSGSSPGFWWTQMILVMESWLGPLGVVGSWGPESVFWQTLCLIRAEAANINVCVWQFLQDILDTLFSILDDNTDKYGPLVFQSLVGTCSKERMMLTEIENSFCLDHISTQLSLWNNLHYYLSTSICLLLSQVFIINLLRDSKYYHFRPVMDTYIQKHFAGALAYKWVFHCDTIAVVSQTVFIMFL